MRTPDYPIDPQFVDRYSTRAFSDQPVSRDQLHQIFEAARWAPSCFNEQPWLVRYALEPADLEIFRPLLVDANRTWADRAPVLGIVFAKKHFALNGNPNPWAPFDAGQAGFSIALQAHLLGLATHFMGGFHKDKTYSVLNVDPEKYEAQAAFVIGYQGSLEVLPEPMRERDAPSGRNPQSAQFVEGLP